MLCLAAISCMSVAAPRFLASQDCDLEQSIEGMADPRYWEAHGKFTEAFGPKKTKPRHGCTHLEQSEV